MAPEDLRGDWEGRFTGTNSGRLYLRLTPVPTGLVAEANLDDDASGPALLLGAAAIVGETLEVSLAARQPEALAQFGTVTVKASLDAQQQLVGEWRTTVGTSGNFLAGRPVPVPAPVSQTPLVSRAGIFEKQRRMPACVVNLDVLRRIHSTLQAGGKQAAEIHDRNQYEAIRGGVDELMRLYRVNVLVRGAQGEVSATDDPSALTLDALPQPLTLIEFEIGVNYRFATGKVATNRAMVRFDFTRPPALDLSNPSGQPTANISTIGAFGADTFWVAGIFERTNALLANTAVHTSWLHRSHTYDALLFVLGLPLAFAVAVLAASGVSIPRGVDAQVFRAAVAVFATVLTLVLFRLAFSLTRWLLPYIEFAPSPEPLHRRIRLLIAGIILAVVTGALGSAAYALLR
jgi:hypothetical protein